MRVDFSQQRVEAAAFFGWGLPGGRRNDGVAMKKHVIFVAALCLALLCGGCGHSRQEAGTKPAVSIAEDQPDFPAAGTLPLVGKLLGVTVEEAFGGRPIINREEHPDEVRQMLAGITMPSPEFVQEKLGEFFVKTDYCDCVAFSLDKGRIYSAVALFKKFSVAQQLALMDQFQQLPEADGGRWVRKSGELLFRADTVRWPMEAPTDSMWLMLDVEDVDWYLRTRKPRTEIADGIRNKKVVVGMSEREAFLAMRNDLVGSSIMIRPGHVVYRYGLYEVAIRDGIVIEVLRNR
jgi:hypothetical protein